MGGGKLNPPGYATALQREFHLSGSLSKSQHNHKRMQQKGANFYISRVVGELFDGRDDILRSHTVNHLINFIHQ